MADLSQVKKLVKRFGAFERATFEFKIESPAFAAWVRNMMRRRGEIVLVVPRGDGRVLLHTKPHYPDAVFRLPTGGVRPKEPAADAAKRETYEEIGFKPRALKLLGVLDNVFSLGETEYVYPSFVFQTEEFTRAPKPTDRREGISGFRDVDALSLRAVARQLENLPKQWREWGRFRAAPHAWLAERVTQMDFANRESGRLAPAHRVQDARKKKIQDQNKES